MYWMANPTYRNGRCLAPSLLVEVCIKPWVPSDSLPWQRYGWAHISGTFLVCHIVQFLLVDDNRAGSRLAYCQGYS